MGKVRIVEPRGHCSGNDGPTESRLIEGASHLVLNSLGALTIAFLRVAVVLWFILAHVASRSKVAELDRAVR